METDALKLLTIPGYTDEKIAQRVVAGITLSDLENEINLETVLP